MAKTNLERQRDYLDRQKARAKAGKQLYAIFAAHVGEIAPLLNADEKLKMNALAEVLE